MSWGIAGDWLAVAGTLLLTLGTGAQAWASQAEYRTLRKALPFVVFEVLKTALPILTFAGLIPDLRRLRHISRRLAKFLEDVLVIGEVAVLSVLFASAYMTLPGGEGNDEAAELARSFRLAVVWGILMAGSALALAGAAVQLALAYQ